MGAIAFSDEAVRTTWDRYNYMRDYAHIEYVRKAEKCEQFFAGNQWDEADLAKLQRTRRPALTINEVLRTISNILGEQIRTRSEIAFRPAKRGNAAIADALQKVYQQISESNQLDWLRSEVYADGLITSRGFYDVRLDFSDNMQGEVRITKPNPKGVLVDPDAEEYDPDDWADVITTRWWNLTEIEVSYGKKIADTLRAQAKGQFAYEFDAIERWRDGFGRAGSKLYLPSSYWNAIGAEGENQVKSIRVIDRQYREATMVEYFVDPTYGDMRKVPQSWDRDRIALEVEKMGYVVLKKPGSRIRWTVVACGEKLFDEPSPYRHFTIVPYFPHFRHGRTIGVVEHLLSPQELLNKATSQELHVINTSANSGWKVKAGNLVNMTTEELEQRGAETGLVVEVLDTAQIDKITANSVPTGLDRMSQRAEEFMKTVSNVSDSMLGFDREDVAAKAIAAKQQRGAVNLIKPIDNLERTDWLLARNILDMVQDYYTEPRILRVTVDEETNKTEEFEVNVPDHAGNIMYDLTLGEYEIIVTSSPDKATIEDSQFEQAKALKELGVNVPDRILIENSRLLRRNELIKQMEEAANQPPPEQQLELAKLQKEIEKIAAEIDRITADAASMRTRAAGEAVRAVNETENTAQSANDDDKMLEALVKQAVGTPTKPKVGQAKGAANEQSSNRASP